MLDRNYSKTRCFGRIVTQIMLESAYAKGFTVHLFPQVSVAFVNREVFFAIGLEWICGTVNVGIARKSYVEHMHVREHNLEERAKKQNLTVKQLRLGYWGW